MAFGNVRPPSHVVGASASTGGGAGGGAGAGAGAGAGGATGLGDRRRSMPTMRGAHTRTAVVVGAGAAAVSAATNAPPAAATPASSGATPQTVARPRRHSFGTYLDLVETPWETVAASINLGPGVKLRDTLHHDVDADTTTLAASGGGGGGGGSGDGGVVASGSGAGDGSTGAAGNRRGGNTAPGLGYASQFAGKLMRVVKAHRAAKRLSTRGRTNSFDDGDTGTLAQFSLVRSRVASARSMWQRRERPGNGLRSATLARRYARSRSRQQQQQHQQQRSYKPARSSALSQMVSPPAGVGDRPAIGAGVRASPATPETAAATTTTTTTSTMGATPVSNASSPAPEPVAAPVPHPEPTLSHALRTQHSDASMRRPPPLASISSSSPLSAAATAAVGGVGSSSSPGRHRTASSSSSSSGAPLISQEQKNRIKMMRNNWRRRESRANMNLQSFQTSRVRDGGGGGGGGGGVAARVIVRVCVCQCVWAVHLVCVGHTTCAVRHRSTVALRVDICSASRGAPHVRMTHPT